MQHHKTWIIAVMIAALPLAGCDKGHDEYAAVHPATVEPTQDSGISRITLTERAAERLGIQLAEVKMAGDRVEAPYSALLYAANGGEWLYASPKPMVFKRIGIKVDRIEGDKMYLSEGPAAGTQVVSVGAAELFGAEFEIGH